MTKTVVDSLTGEVLFCTTIAIDLLEGQELIDSEATGNYYDFETHEFYMK